MMLDVTPEPEEVVQAEEPYDPHRPINVTVCGPVQTREVPAVRSGYRTEQAVGTTVGVRLLPLEPRRKTGRIIALSQDIWISNSQAGAQSGASGAMRIPASVPYPVDHLDEVWACAVTGTTDISVESAFWSE